LVWKEKEENKERKDGCVLDMVMVADAGWLWRATAVIIVGYA